MLSQYHLRFLEILKSNKVDFLVIGGQARYMHFATATRDLDIWAPTDHERANRLECALKSWIAIHPVHNDFIAFSTGPLSLRPNMQIHIPTHDAYYLGENDEALSIAATDGIDILTSLHSMDFDACQARACSMDTDKGVFLYLNVSDWETSQALGV